jgi:hypothetical protein
MNPARRYCAALLAFFLISIPVFAGKIRTVNKEYYPNGNLKAVTITIVTTPNHADLFNYYKKTKVTRTEFDSVITRKSLETVRITKLGRGGRPCYEYYYKKINYDKNGKRTRFEVTDCDKSKYKVKEYTNGKVSFVRKQKRRRWLWW